MEGGLPADLRPPVTVRIDHLLQEGRLREELARDVRAGFSRSPMTLRSRWVWDARGSSLFERILELPAYELPRRERALLGRCAAAVASLARPDVLLELGAGSSARTPLLLDSLVPSGLRRYTAVDVSPAALEGALPALAARYPQLEITGAVADFERQLALLDPGARPLVALLGSTIGALERGERAALLASAAGVLGADGALLLGLDLVKPVEALLAAYDHGDELAGGLIANALLVVNRELDADFRLDRFRSEQRWNGAEERVEMLVRSLADQVVTIRALDLEVPFAEGVALRTELSCKFRRRGVEEELRAAGLAVAAWWEDAPDGFALCLARRA